MNDVMSFLELVTDKSEPPEPIIGNGILLPQTLLTIIGAPKVGKSFLAFNIATALASGNGFACFKIDKRQKTLILSAEGGYYPNKDRIKRITNNIDRKSLQNHAYIKLNCNLYIDKKEHYDEIEGLISKHKIDVLILDPFIRFHHQEENSSSSMSEVMALIRQLIMSTNVSVILIHHTGKQVSRGGRGSSVITGEYDSAIYMEKRCNGKVQLKFDMRHVEIHPNIDLQFNSDTFWFEESMDSATESENQAVALLKKNGGRMKKSDIVKKLEENNTASSSTAYRWIDSAKKDNEITENLGKLEVVE